MKWIKKGNVAAAVGAALLLWLLGALFFDTLLRWALIRGGQSAAEARVEIGSVKTRLFKGSLELSNVAIADKKEPMRNLLEFDRADLRFSPAQALRAKAVIEDAGLVGLRFGTPRKKSGALRRSKPSKFETMVEGQLAPAKQQTLAKVEHAKAVVPEVDPDKLASAKALDEAEGRLKAASYKAEERLGVPSMEARIKEIQADVDALKKGGGSPAETAAKIKKAQDLQRRIKTLLAQVQASRDAANRDIDQVQAALRKADDLKSKDVNGVLAAAGLPALDAESMTKRLLGPQAAKKISTALYWIRWARKRQASQKEKATEPPAPRRGVDIEFPHPRSMPEFLLVKGTLAGEAASLFEGRDMSLAGTLSGVTSNPPLFGKPTLLALEGAAKGGPSMRLDGRLDQTREPGAIELKLGYSGFPLAGLSLGDQEVAADVKAGVGRVDGTVRVVGDQYKGQFVLQADGVTLEPKIGLGGSAAGYAASALKGVRRFTATVSLEGRENDLHFSVASDIGQTLADGLKKAASSELLAQRKKVEQKVDALYARRAKDLHARTNSLQAQLLGPLDKQQKTLEEQLRRAAAGALASGDLKKTFGKLFR
jgi:uncharacterized protein (TIGR03545 family)